MISIKRNVDILADRFKAPIELSQGTDGIPVIFYFVNYAIPTGTTAIVFVSKPSGKAIQGVATVNQSNNTVTINIDKQMVAEKGESLMQVQLMQGGKNIFTFNHPVLVTKSAVPINSENGSTFLDEYLPKIDKATKDAIRATEDIQSKAQNGDFSATVNVGSVVTGDPGTAAAVKNSGTVKDAVLDFKVPKGDQGESGVMAATAGMFSLYLDPATGNLYAEYPDGSEPPKFILEQNGDLYYVTDDGGETL